MHERTTLLELILEATTLPNDGNLVFEKKISDIDSISLTIYDGKTFGDYNTVDIIYKFMYYDYCTFCIHVHINDDDIKLTINGDSKRRYEYSLQDLKLYDRNKDIIEFILMTGNNKSIFDKDILYIAEEQIYYKIIDYKHHLIKGIQNEL